MSFLDRVWVRRPRPFWWEFRLGYLTALDDIDRTGLKPKTEKTKEECAARAWRRYANDKSDPMALPIEGKEG